MAILHNNVIPFVGGEYTIDQSLRFDSASSAHMTRTPASASNRKTWTFSAWIKRGKIGDLGGDSVIFGGDAGNSADYSQVRIYNSNTPLDAINFSSNVGATQVTWSPLLRDTSSWYHLMMVLDTTQATDTNRIKVYVNGEQITSTVSATWPSQNSDHNINNNIEHQLGELAYAGTTKFDGYLAEVHFIDGQALTPDYFGEVDETYGHWKPIEYTGTYGTNGFYLPFSGTFYNDASGNGNNWTANNLATTDVVLDSPTNNFATLNPLLLGSAITMSNGNLEIAKNTSNDWRSVYGTVLIPTSGKWYWELTAGDQYVVPGITLASGNLIGSVNTYPTDTLVSYTYYGYDGQKYNGPGNVGASYGATYTTNDVIGIAFDADAGTLTFYKNGVSQGTAFSSLTAQYLPTIGCNTSGVNHVLNFGQDSSFAGNKTAQNNTDANGYGDFYYSPPSGFLALCTANLSDPAVVPGENFNTVLWAGNGSQTRSLSGVGFQPDFTWMKSRSIVQEHQLYDVVRGAGGAKMLCSNQTAAEGQDGSGNSDSDYGYIASFDTDGFSLNDGAVATTGGWVNYSGQTYTAWNWKADNTSGSSNTDGSITSTVAANVSGGFSVVSYTGNSTTGATVGHGLSQAPEMVILKNRSAVQNWAVAHKDLNSNYALILDLTLAQVSAGTRLVIGNSTTFTVGDSADYGITNQSTHNYIAYCFHSVDGYSKFGSYTGNGSTDGPFVYTGFRPAFVLVKRTDSAVDWVIADNKRTASYNPADGVLVPNLSSAEQNLVWYDFLSNGFKARQSYSGLNASGGTYIYMAFAEYPFKYTTAR